MERRQGQGQGREKEPGGEPAMARLIGQVLELGKKTLPGAELLVSLRGERSANTRFARSEITSTGDVDEVSLEVSAAFGRRHASAAGNQTDEAGLRALLARVGQLGRIAPEDPEHMPLLGPQRYQAVPSAYDEATSRLSAAERAAGIKSAIEQGDAHKLDVSGFYEHSSETWALGSSSGLFAFHRRTEASFTTTARTLDGSGSGWAGAASQRSADVVPAALSAVAIDKAVRAQRPRPLPPGRYTVVLEPAAVANLLFFLLRSLDARTADEGRSFFARPGGNRMGERLFGDAITLRSDPADEALPSAPFGEDGLPARPRTWIDKGTLSALWYSRYWAEKQAKEPTGAPRSVHLLGGRARDADLLSGVKRGVLITRFWYTRWVDPQSLLVTGLTRDGVFLIEDGRVTTPVNNFRFNESPITMLKNADALTERTVRTPDSGLLVRVPALRTHGFNLASVSDAI